MKRIKTIVAAIVIAGLSMACCRASEKPAAGFATVELAASDLSGIVNLSPADRIKFTDKCIARRTELFANFEVGNSIKREDLQELKDNIDETFPRFCGCLEGQLEKGLSKMQFVMAETMIDQGIFISYPGSPMPKFEALKTAATQRDMSETDFENARQRFRMHASHSAEACFLTLWGPTLARRMGIPELRSYSGPAPGSR
jgi:hypothetical protein